MPELLLDLGNTRLKWGWLDGGLEPTGSAADFSTVLASLPAQAHHAWLSSVADPERTSALRQQLDAAGIACTEVGVAAYRHLLPTRYAEGQLGVDRWLAALAGYRRAGGACVVVDAGTATTIDLVDAGGIHLGGYILPGSRLAAEALFRGTAIGPQPQRAECDDSIPGDTPAAIHCGSLAAQAALIERVCTRLGECRLYIGGGDGERLLPHVQFPHELFPQPVLAGLACLARAEA